MKPNFVTSWIQQDARIAHKQDLARFFLFLSSPRKSPKTHASHKIRKSLENINTQFISKMTILSSFNRLHLLLLGITLKKCTGFFTLTKCTGFFTSCSVYSSKKQFCPTNFGLLIQLKATPGNNEDNPGDEGADEGADLAAQFFNTIKNRPDIEKLLDDVDDLEDMYNQDDDQEENEQDEDDEESTDKDIPIGRVNIFRGRDEGKVGKLAGNTTFTNKELYETIKERVLESPKAFVDYVGGEDAAEEMSAVDESYKPPSLIPDAELTAGEVVELVLKALNNNDIGPTTNYGVQVLFAYSSKQSFLKQTTVEEYAEFMKESEYSPLLSHTQVIIDKADYSHDKRKAFYNVRIKPADTTDRRSFTSVNFILSKQTTEVGDEQDDCWLIDSAVVRTEGLGRSRRRK